MLRRFWFFVTRWRRLEEIDEEMRLHVELRAAVNRRDGLNAEDAERRARVRFGNITRIREETRDAWGWRWAEHVIQDLRHAYRSLKATPVVATVAVLSLAFGIGANTTIFSILESLFLRPLPVVAPEQLVLLRGRTERRTHFTNPIWEQIRDRAPGTFADALAWHSTRINLSDGGETDFVSGLWVSGSFFRTLGVQPSLGRMLTESDDRRGGGTVGPVAVISYGFWQRRFGGATDAVGQTLTIERVPYTVVGVAEPEFFGLDVGRTFDVAIPIGTEPLVRGDGSWLDRRSNWWLQVMFRLRPEQGIETADREILNLYRQVHDATLPPGWSPNDYLPEGFALAPAAGGASDLRERYRRPLIAIMAIVSLVLGVACANIVNLLLARAAVRRREFSLKTALGASQWRIARQLLCESALLAGAGGTLGTVIALWGSEFLVRQLSTSTNAVFLPLGLNWQVFGFTAAVSTGTVLLFGIAPAMRASRTAPHDALTGGRTVAGDRRSLGFSQLMVVAQVTLTLVLVVAAGLFAGSLTSLIQVPLGFLPEQVLVATVTVPADVAAERRPQLFQELMTAAAAAPGVSSAALSETTPLSGNTWNNRVRVIGSPRTDLEEALAYYNAVSPGWFRTIGTQLLAGRDFSATDSADALPVAIVNKAFARTFTNDSNPIGMSLQQGDTSRLIVGLVENAVYEAVRDPAPATVYLPSAQRGPYPPYVSISLRTISRTTTTLIRPVLSALTEVNSTVGITIRPLSDQVSASMTQERMVASLSSFFGGLALLLAALGLYGVTAYGVSQRRSEIGVRIALGAQPTSVVRIVMSRLAVLVGLGLVAGTALSLWAGRFVAGLLFGVEAADFRTLAVAGSVVLVTALVAGGIPAVRAACLDPARALRES